MTKAARQPMKELFGVGLLLTVFGILMLFEQVPLLVWGLASRRWPTTPGRVQKADLGSFNLGPRLGARALAQIQYRYLVDDMAYTGQRVSFAGYVWNSDANARRVLERYPAGARVKVAYDPREPTRCVLEPGVNAGAWARALLGPAMLALGLWWMR